MCWLTSKQQVLVTTHSPMILNYLDDEVARAGVHSQDPTRITRSVPFFSIPSVSEKLEVMGPGEALVDTNLGHLYEEILTMQAKTPKPMLVRVSGEGVTDMGRCVASDDCSGAEFEAGPTGVPG